MKSLSQRLYLKITGSTEDELGEDREAPQNFTRLLLARTGRKTHLVNLGDGNQRTDYVSVGNTLIGVQLLAAGLLTGLVALHSIEWTLAIFAVCAAFGALYGRRLKA